MQFTNLREQAFAVIDELRQKAAVDTVDFAQESVERRGLDRGIVLERREQLSLALELLQDVSLEIRARRDVGDLEEREQRGVMVRWGGLLAEEYCPAIEVLQTHQGPDTLVQRMLVTDHF